MSCEKINGCLLGIDGTFAAAMAITGGVTACVASAAFTTVLVAAGIFAVPALILGAATLVGTQFFPINNSASKFTKSLSLLGSGALFAVSSAAVLAGAVALGILSSAFIVPFIVVASIITVLLLGWGASLCLDAKSTGDNPISLPE